MGEKGKKSDKEVVQFLNFLFFNALIFLGHGTNNHKLKIGLGIPISYMDTKVMVPHKNNALISEKLSWI